MVLSTQKHESLTRCLAECGQALARTQHFTVYAQKTDQATPVKSEDLIVVHHFKPTAINNNIGYFVVRELLPALAELNENQQTDQCDQPYRLNDQQVFERFVGDIVRSMDGSEARAWHNFYDNTLSELAKSAQQYKQSTLSTDSGRQPEMAEYEPDQNFIDNFAAIYQCAAELLDIGSPGESLSLLDVATCFGFFPLFIHQQQELVHPQQSFNNHNKGFHASKSIYHHIAGCDNNPALVDLANSYVDRREHKAVRFILADILAPDKRGALASQPQFDVVTAIHLLEHLQPHQTEFAIANLWQLTRRRLIISVPFEEKPDKQYGHLQVFDPVRLRFLAESLNTSYQFFENRGGWIVLDRPPNKARSSSPTTSTTTSTTKRSDYHAEISH